jgi:Fe-S cluster biogenesis protein NfuA
VRGPAAAGVLGGGATYATLFRRSSSSEGHRHDAGRVNLPGPVTVPRERILKICEDIIAPLVHADGGELYLVAIEPDSISLHLAGTCAGCPGAHLTSAAVIEPAIHAVAPLLRVIVTSGFQIPPGAAAVTTAEARPSA